MKESAPFVIMNGIPGLVIETGVEKQSSFDISYKMIDIFFRKLEKLILSNILYYIVFSLYMYSTKSADRFVKIKC